MNDEQKNTYYELTINCLLNNVDTTLYFDYVSENTVSLTTDITTHPLVTGDMIADHQYVNPSTLNFSGTFSLYGNKKTYSVLSGDDYISEDFGTNGNNRLLYIEDIFEQIQKQGIHCNIVKMSPNRDTSRFKARNNMILTAITWTEHQFSVDFEFSFTEALTADIPNEDEYIVDDSDPDLPLLTEPTQRKAVDELLDKGEVTKQVVLTLQNEELLEEKFLQTFDFERFLKFKVGVIVTYYVVATAAGLAALGVIAGICGGLSAAVPVGTIIAGAIAITAATVAAFTLIFKRFKQKLKYNIDRFRYYKDEAKKEKEEDRFVEFISEICTSLEVLDNNITSVGFDKNIQQQCIINIDNNLYAFTFTRPTENDIYCLSVTTIDEDGNTIEVAKIQNIYEKSIATLYECNNDTMLFSDKKTGTQVYIVDYLGAKQVQDTAEQGKEPEITDEDIRDLRNYGIIICTIDMNKFSDVISDSIASVLFKS